MNIGAVVADGTLWVAIPIAVLAGLISFLSPCVLPLVPGYLGFIGGAVAPRPVPRPVPVSSRSARSTTDDRAAAPAPATVPEPVEGPGRSRLLLGVLLFIAGFTVVFVSAAMLGGTLGRFLIEYADIITRILGVLIIAMGLVFIGLFGFAQRTFRPQVRSNLGLVGAPLLGVALGIGWTPCIGPTLAVILQLSFDSGSAARGAVLGLAYSLGLGIPFVLLTLGFGWATRSVGFLRRHIRVVNIVGGSVLIVLGLLMVTGVWNALMAQLQGVFQSVPLPI
ncbi:cytochrome c-type biogenesis protein [Microbacterium terrae]|uniref:Cytochrome C biogenesis protein transmembrane region n=1 Tax=Microbacterium terrae TaxID=69369 RepID=A0A0M2GVB5_9MICO|nr:cytochrome c biogenesis protein CcdA [Microbacterium terrae]KJL37447.1 Cytochrome C biogenesis protein transmembrane region [Microbacterium terrae]MBP1076275.1 cytochrome c-type biogenesis protein [Microbacterium terrae]GLJ97097.1 cytochrome C biogenesis protein CcdA [Microbacterium terrae]